MPTTTNPATVILIAGITPYFLERDALWFQEHLEAIRKKSRTDEWWERHTLFVEADARLPFSLFLRKLVDLGYVKVARVENRGEFATRGGIVDVSPINREGGVRIEFAGNSVASISAFTVAAELKPQKSVVVRDPNEYERLWLSGLKPGDYLVHIDHGIGVFSGIEDSYYVLEYASPRHGRGMPDRLLVPRHQAKKLSRYIGFETPTIHRLGGTVWEHTKRKAKVEALEFARELFDIFRNRAAARRPPYHEHLEIERALADSFPYEETPDQRRALEEIHADLSRERPMDRLLLGDVGFGKTELALRAAARVAYNGKQVALLAPTTILADQHFATFRERLRSLPLRVEVLTRLTPKRDERHIVERIRRGEADIAIGTKRLLSKDVEWRDLGLVIVDEEQRFGVGEKESLKKLRRELDPVRGRTPQASAAPIESERASNGVDILSLSATPIPRTLSLALAKFRDLSLIQTPPRGRLPIQTFVLPFSERTVAEAIAAERERRGQVFYLWNRIESIDAVRRDLERLAPKSKIAILHGRINERELITVMRDFRKGKIEILLATTIIENGLDLPSVNTLVVANAARLGLSQAYQIRGRIGRAELPAYAYFLYPPRALTGKGKLRLQALREAEAVGSGFQIALKDLEIRGAGNVLGKQQSGTMNKVGLNLYAQLLGEALEELE